MFGNAANNQLIRKTVIIVGTGIKMDPDFYFVRQIEHDLHRKDSQSDQDNTVYQAIIPGESIDLANSNEDESSGGGEDGCGVGMFVEVEGSSEGDEIYMPEPDSLWYW